MKKCLSQTQLIEIVIDLSKFQMILLFGLLYPYLQIKREHIDWAFCFNSLLDAPSLLIGLPLSLKLLLRLSQSFVLL